MSIKLPDDVVSAYCRKVVGPNLWRAITACNGRGYFAGRSLDLIRMAAREFGVKPGPLLAAGMFLPNAEDPEQYVDVLNVGPDAIDTAELLDAPVTVAAFALGRLFAGNPKAVAPLAYTTH